MDQYTRHIVGLGFMTASWMVLRLVGCLIERSADEPRFERFWTASVFRPALRRWRLTSPTPPSRCTGSERCRKQRGGIGVFQFQKSLIEFSSIISIRW